MLLPDVAPQHAGIGSGRARMTLAVLENAVTGNHHKGISHRQPRDFLRNAVDEHHSSLFAIAGESVRRETLTRSRPLEIVVTDIAISALPSFVEDRGG